MPEKILVVDDEKLIRWTLGEALRGWGYQPVEASTVKETLDIFDSESPALTLLDINLPDGSGLNWTSSTPHSTRRSHVRSVWRRYRRGSPRIAIGGSRSSRRYRTSRSYVSTIPFASRTRYLT